MSVVTEASEACSSQSLSTYRPAEVEFLVHVACGHALDQVLQPIDSTPVGSQHEHPFPHFDIQVIFHFESCLLGNALGTRMAKLFPHFWAVVSIFAVLHSIA